MVSRQVTVRNQLGMHARAAARFVHAASAFGSQIRVARGARTMDGKSISEAQKIEGVSIKHDVAVPVSRVADFLAEAGAALHQAYPGARIVAFGHIGDGNIHYNVSLPGAARNQAFIEQHEQAVNRIVYGVVAKLEGSISAEHGLGQLKREEITRYKSALELELMRAIKHTLDPQGRMNPGKVL